MRQLLRHSGQTCSIADTSYEGTTETPDATTTMAFETWEAIQSGELNRVEAFMGGLIQVEGDLTLLMQLEDMLNRFSSPPPED